MNFSTTREQGSLESTKPTETEENGLSGLKPNGAKTYVKKGPLVQAADHSEGEESHSLHFLLK